MMDDTWWRDPSQLDASQRALIELPIDGNFLIKGPPGSGKTNLLMLRAAFLDRSGHNNIFVVTFNRTLREFLASGSQNYRFSPEKIKTFMKFGIDLLNNCGINFKKEEKFIEFQKEISEKLRENIDLISSKERCDAILLDESQDYSDDEIAIFRQLADRVFAVGDLRQQIYDDRGGVQALEAFCTTPEPLKYQYRNGLKICRVADCIANRRDHPHGLEATAQYDERTNPSSVDWTQSDNFEEQAAAILESLRNQLRAYPDERLGVACVRHVELEAVWNYLAASDLQPHCQLLRQNDYAPLSSDKRILVATVHGTKGLEFRALHIVGSEHISKWRKLSRNLAFTAVTRAKTSLTLHSISTLPGFLASAVSAVNDVPDTPSVEELFS